MIFSNTATHNIDYPEEIYVTGAPFLLNHFNGTYVFNKNTGRWPAYHLIHNSLIENFYPPTQIAKSGDQWKLIETDWDHKKYIEIYGPKSDLPFGKWEENNAYFWVVKNKPQSWWKYSPFYISFIVLFYYFFF